MPDCRTWRRFRASAARPAADAAADGDRWLLRGHAAQGELMTRERAGLDRAPAAISDRARRHRDGHDHDRPAARQDPHRRLRQPGDAAHRAARAGGGRLLGDRAVPVRRERPFGT